MAAAIPRPERLTGALRRAAVKKHVGAIHVSGKLTLVQRKLSNVLLLNAYDTLVAQRTHRIDVQALCYLAGYNSNDIETLKQSLTGLAETVAHWNVLDDKGQEEWGVSSLLSYAKIKAGVCEYAYSEALAEKLNDPAVFAQINMHVQRQFSSGHALALYENCYRFKRIGTTGWWPLETFRKLMGVEDSHYYTVFKQLNAKLIKPAVAEVNRCSDILLTPETRRMGRAVSDIRFAIAPNPQLSSIDMDDDAGLRKTDAYARMIALGVGDRLARQWIAENGAARVEANLDEMAARGGVRKPQAYLAQMLKAGQGEDPVPETAPTSARAAQLKVVKNLVASRTPTQRDADRRLFMASLSDTGLRADFESHGWMSPRNYDTILAFWMDLYPEHFDLPSGG